MTKFLRRLSCFLFSFLMVGSLLCGSAPKAAAASGGAVFTPEEQALIDRGKTLRVGFVQDRVPVSFSDKNGDLAGISRYIFDRIQYVSGLQFEYVPLPAGDVTYAFLTEQSIDLVTSVEFNEENKNARGILMSDPYLSSRKVMVARRDFSYSPDAPLSVALCTGSQTLKKVMHEQYPSYTLVDYSTIEDCFSAVDRGEVDVMILNQYVVEYWLYRPVYEDLKVIPLLGLDDQLCFSAIVPYGENGEPLGEEGQLLISILDKTISQLDENRIESYTIQAIMENRYSYTAGDFLYRYRYAFMVLTVSLVLISGLLYLLVRLRFQTVKAKADVEARNRFLSTMSHEIRTPLHGLIGLNYLMTQKLDDREQLSKYLSQSTTTAKYLLSLVNDILDMSMLRSGDVELEQKPVDMELMLASVEAVAHSGMTEKGVDFRMSWELTAPGIIGDSVRIQQVLLNLLDNARKFTPEGGSVTVTVGQTLLPEGRVCTRADVTDSGKGMSEAFQKTIFEVFSQERETVSKGDQGVGLGLPISHRLAKLMGGDLSFTSRPGEGSVFTFTFTAPVTELAAGTKNGGAGADGFSQGGVLVAEDNELNVEIMLELLSANGFAAELVPNGQEALERFSVSAPGEFRVILMDLLMPEMDGFAAASAIRALSRPDAGTVHIFACSANCTEEDRRKAMAAGMDGFLAKPVDVDLLLEKLNS